MKRNMTTRIKTVYCKSCRSKYIEINCDACANRHKGICGECIHWRGTKDHFEMNKYYVTKEKE